MQMSFGHTVHRYAFVAHNGSQQCQALAADEHRQTVSDSKKTKSRSPTGISRSGSSSFQETANTIHSVETNLKLVSGLVPNKFGSKSELSEAASARLVPGRKI